MTTNGKSGAWQVASRRLWSAALLGSVAEMGAWAGSSVVVSGYWWTGLGLRGADLALRQRMSPPMRSSASCGLEILGL